MRIPRTLPAFALVLLAIPTVDGGRSVGSSVTTGKLQPAAAVAALPSDFDGNGVQDRAIGVPDDTTEHWWFSGGFHVLYSPGPDGTRPSNQYFTTQSNVMQQLLDMYPTGLGRKLASGDFDRDGYADLAVTISGFDEPDESNPRINVGGVVVIYGTDHGLDPNAAQPAELWSQDTEGVQGLSEDDDSFGSALVVGDFDADGFLDLAIGIAGEQTGPDARHSGAVTVLYGARGGLTPRDQVVDQDTRGILDTAEAGDWAGHSLAAGDFNADGVDDLALGVKSEGVDGTANAGAVNVIYGTRDVGLTGRGDRFVNQAQDAVPGIPRRDDWFGQTLTVGDFNGDSFDDLVVGAPLDVVRGVDESGSATFIPGSEDGLVLIRSVFFHLGQIEYGAEGSNFSAALAAGDVNGDGYDDLAVGSPRYGWHSGRVDILPGSAGGPTIAGAQTLLPTDLDEPALVADTQAVGYTLQLAQLDTVPGADLLVGMPLVDVRVEGSRIGQAGAVAEIPSRGGALDPTARRLYHQGVLTGAPDEGERLGSALPGSGLYFD